MATLNAGILTGVAAWRCVRERAEAFVGAHVQRAVLYESPQLNASRYVGLRTV